jgi:hypothetical protein
MPLLLKAVSALESSYFSAVSTYCTVSYAPAAATSSSAVSVFTSAALFLQQYTFIHYCGAGFARSRIILVEPER